MMVTALSEMLTNSPNGELGSKVEKAIETIGQYSGAVVALSAGVDSSLVAALARKALGTRAIAATAVSESLPPGELEIAQKTATEVGIQHLVIRTSELDNPNYSSNPSNRCYYCKETLYHELQAVAKELSFEAILDGTHMDDLADDRPGLKAAREAGVKSPLLAAGFSKKDVREAAKLLGLSVWDKPAMPCLSSRIAHGERVTVEKLSSIGQAEQYIKEITGIRELRVRFREGHARIEVAPKERHLLFDETLMDVIDERLKNLGFESVSVDMRGYTRKVAEAETLVLPVIAD